MKWATFSGGSTVAMSLATLMTWLDLWARLGWWGSFFYGVGLVAVMFSSVDFRGGAK
jgi:hypothetical protein